MNTGSKTIGEIIESLARNISPGAFLTREVPREAHSNWREEVHVVYCVGKGKFGDNADFKQRQFINLQMDMYDLGGKWVGYQLGVHESTSTLQDLLNPPPPPTGAWNEPSPVPELPFKEWTKGIWTFRDGSAVYAVGQAYSQLVPLAGGAFMFMVTTGQVITNGTGRYEGAHGIKQATGTTLVPAGLLESGKFPAPGITFDAKTIEVFRIVKREDLTEPKTGGKQSAKP